MFVPAVAAYTSVVTALLPLPFRFTSVVPLPVRKNAASRTGTFAARAAASPLFASNRYA